MSQILAASQIREFRTSWQQCFSIMFLFSMGFFPSQCVDTETCQLDQTANLHVSCIFQPLISKKESHPPLVHNEEFFHFTD